VCSSHNALARRKPAGDPTLAGYLLQCCQLQVPPRLSILFKFKSMLDSPHREATKEDHGLQWSRLFKHARQAATTVGLTIFTMRLDLWLDGGRVPASERAAPGAQLEDLVQMVDYKLSPPSLSALGRQSPRGITYLQQPSEVFPSPNFLV
jgi:hypothetical protein